MADLTQIEYNGTTYDIKDADAYDTSKITYTTTDPGAGSALTTGNIILVYQA